VFSDAAGSWNAGTVRHYTAPYSTYSQARFLQGEVRDVTPAAIATMQQYRTEMVNQWYEGMDITSLAPELYDNFNASAKDAKEYVAELIKSVEITPTKCCVSGCDSAGTSWCGKCHAVKYCSRQHQVQDWKVRAVHIAVTNMLATHNI
jgi:MYND finger